MRKGCALGMLATIAACSADRPGLAIEVTTDTPISSIEVFLGQKPCTGPDGGACAITPPDMTAALRTNTGGGAWYRDGEPVFRGDASGDYTWFRIEPTESPEMLQLIAVGFDAAGTPVVSGVLRDLAIPDTQTTYLSLALQAAGVVDAFEEGTQPHADGDFVRVWNNATSDCVVAEHWHGGLANRMVIVPHDDADCDGFATTDPVECDPLWAGRNSLAPTFSDARCVTPRNLTALAPTCLLGGSPCVDGVVPSSLGCAPIDPKYCVPSVMCDPMCSAGPLPSCFSRFSASQLHCVIYADDSGNPCDTAIIPKPQSGTTTGVGNALGSGGHTWTSVAMSDASTWNMLAPISPWPLPLPASAKLRAAPSTTVAGELDVTWTSGLAPKSFIGTQMVQWGFAELTINNGHHMLFPLRVGYSLCTVASGVTNGVDCYMALDAQDGVTACAN